MRAARIVPTKRAQGQHARAGAGLDVCDRVQARCGPALGQSAQQQKDRKYLRLLRWHLQPPPPPTRKKHNIRCARNRALAESARRSRNRSAQRFEVYTVVKFRQALGFRLSALPPTCKRLRGVEFGHEAGSFGSHRSCLDAHMRSRERRACEAGEFCKIPPVLVMMPLIFLLFHCTRLACCHVALFVAKGNVEPRGNFRVFVHA